MRSALLAILLATTTLADQLHWRLIGPFRGGRVTAVAGVPGKPNLYYFGTPGAGIWKSTSGGQVWKPIFDATGVPSIGALAVAPSDANIIYAGTGERHPGRGVFKSTDGGTTWSAAGLDQTRFIQALIVDPRNPNHVIAGVNSVGYSIIWRPLPATAFTNERGIYETRDGGRNWRKVLSKDDTLGVVDLCADPNNTRSLYAVLFHAATGKGEAAVAGTSDLYRSTDGGSTWKPLGARGLPSKARGRVGISVAKGVKGRRLYAVLDSGFFRSDDGGEHWRQSSTDPRVVASNYFGRVFADPTNTDTVYVSQTSMYRSTDGGRTFEAFAGAPSGDDFHLAWIDPQDGNRILLGVDQGAIATMDGGNTWTDWNNQPTGEFYHVSTDQAFPYRVYAAQQDSGTAAVLSRSDYGQIRPPDWAPIGGFEYTYIAPDPAHANLVYSQGWYGSVVRYDRNTGMVSTVFDKGDVYRTAQMAPLAFSPQDAKTLYFGTQFLLRTVDGGVNWERSSPDLTGFVEHPADAERDPDAPRDPAISTLSLSPLREGTIWAGTSNHVVQLTEDGGLHWRNVTPPGLGDPMGIQIIEAGHHEAATAYVAAGAPRYGKGPFLARTHDAGKSWRVIVEGIPASDSVEVVREDPKRQGLLYAGTTSGVFVSYDDGDHWKSLQLNLPHTVVTDLDVHQDDLVASTYGRALWILDGLAAVREPSTETRLYPLSTTIRARWDNYQDTPLQPETPTGENPPDGVIIDYYVQSAAAAATLTISTQTGEVVRRFSSSDRPPDLRLPNVPRYWFGPEQPLESSAGLHRFIWDLRVAPPKSLPYSYGGELLNYTEYTLADHAIPGNTPRQQPTGPLVPPGTYLVELVLDGKSHRQTLIVQQDPRVSVSSADLLDQWQWEQKLLVAMETSYNLYFEASDLLKKASGEVRKKELEAIIKGTAKAPGVGPINRDLTRLMTSIQSGDVRPSNTVREAIETRLRALAERTASWQSLAR